MSTTGQKSDLFPKALLASIGVAAVTLDWMRTFANRVIERGEIAEMEAQEADQQAQPEPAAGESATAKGRPWIATRSDYLDLQKQLEQLDEEIMALEQQRAKPSSEAASEGS